MKRELGALDRSLSVAIRAIEWPVDQGTHLQWANDCRDGRIIISQRPSNKEESLTRRGRVTWDEFRQAESEVPNGGLERDVSDRVARRRGERRADEMNGDPSRVFRSIILSWCLVRRHGCGE